jgi:hypothetical protein
MSPLGTVVTFDGCHVKLIAFAASRNPFGQQQRTKNRFAGSLCQQISDSDIER